jgi:hypothetical protein
VPGLGGFSLDPLFPRATTDSCAVLKRLGDRLVLLGIDDSNVFCSEMRAITPNDRSPQSAICLLTHTSRRSRALIVGRSWGGRPLAGTETPFQWVMQENGSLAASGVAAGAAAAEVHGCCCFCCAGKGEAERGVGGTCSVWYGAESGMDSAAAKIEKECLGPWGC